MDRVNNNKAYKDLLNDTRDKKFISAFGLQPNEKPFVANAVNGFCLYVCSDYVEAQRIYRTMQAISCGKVVYVPFKEDVLLYKRNASKNSVFARNAALHSVLRGADAAVVCIDALMQYYPERNLFFKQCFTLRKGARYDSSLLIKRLVKCGYTRVDGISAEGEFTMRGDILDLSLPFSERFRIDFFDDEIESIRSVNGEGVAEGEVALIEIYPLYDTCGFPVEKFKELEKYIRRFKLSADAQARLSEIVSELSASGDDTVDSSWLLPFVKRSALSEYLPEDTVIVWDEPKQLYQRAQFLYKEHAERVANLTKAGEVLPAHLQTLRDRDTAFEFGYPQIAMQTLPYATEFFKPQTIRNFKTGAVSNYSMNENGLATDVRNWLRGGYETVILAGTDGVKATRDKLAENGVYMTEADRLVPNKADGLILPIGVEHGFVSHTNKLVVIGTRDLGRGLNNRSMRKSKRQAFLSVEKGDYVVHDVHSIGLCEGI
ncbi:MAG: hypothetical protein NC332_03455, partial [Firmicutes bacterium]|nr:hypothetical protein [Bacillota bacterium]